MNAKLISLLALVALTCADYTSAASITVVENGRACAVIVVPTAKPVSAVADLRAYIEKATGARIEVVEEDKLGRTAATGCRIFVGACNAAKRVVDVAQLQPEGFVIKSDGNDLFIVGRDTTDSGLVVAGTQHGVSEF